MSTAFTNDAGGIDRVFHVDQNTSFNASRVRVTGGRTDQQGGGILSDMDSTLRVTDSLVDDNYARSTGGGIHVQEASSVFVRTTFSNNLATGQGGGLSQILGDATIIDSTFQGNTASRGGGLYNQSANVAITGSTFHENATEELLPDDPSGAAIFAQGPTSISNSTISNNASAGRGGGILVNGTVVITNSTIVVGQRHFRVQVIDGLIFERLWK